MNTSELRDILSATSPRPWKVGVFARDEIPKPPLNRKCLYICNTDSSHKPGSHWVVLCINGKGERLYFDAYGLPPMYSEFRHFSKTMCTTMYSCKNHFPPCVDIIVCCLLDICLLDTVWNRLFVNWNLIRMQTLKEFL